MASSSMRAQRPALFASQRQQAITELLATRDGQAAGVAAIADALQVATETVRRDLDALARRGQVRRVRGGAELITAPSFDPALAARRADQSAAKRAIAAGVLEAVQKLDSGGVLVLDSGSLACAVAELMAAERSVPRSADASGPALTVVTNNLLAAVVLAAQPGLTVMTLSGTIRGVTQATVSGGATHRLETIRADLAVVAVNGLSAALGLTTTTPDEAAVKRAMLGCARRRLVPVVAARLGQDAFCHFAAVNEVDMIITDDAADPGVVAELRSAGPQVEVVRGG